MISYAQMIRSKITIVTNLLCGLKSDTEFSAALKIRYTKIDFQSEHIRKHRLQRQSGMCTSSSQILFLHLCLEPIFCYYQRHSALLGNCKHTHIQCWDIGKATVTVIFSMHIHTKISFSFVSSNQQVALQPFIRNVEGFWCILLCGFLIFYGLQKNICVGTKMLLQAEPFLMFSHCIDTREESLMLYTFSLLQPSKHVTCLFSRYQKLLPLLI